MMINVQGSAERIAPAPTAALLDPLEHDRADDARIVTTRRAISRVALVAAETAGRFQREGVSHDPMTWMLAPRTVFGGEAAVDACLARDACLRGILLHGLSLGLDADPDAIDALADEDDEDDIDWTERPDDEPPAGRNGVVVPFPLPTPDRPRLRLFTAVVVGGDGGETVHAFHASLAHDEAEVAGRLFMRMGPACADAVIVDGFDAAHPMVEALVAPAIADTLRQVAVDPGSPLAAGLDLNVEQRFYG